MRLALDAQAQQARALSGAELAPDLGDSSRRNRPARPRPGSPSSVAWSPHCASASRGDRTAEARRLEALAGSARPQERLDRRRRRLGLRHRLRRPRPRARLRPRREHPRAGHRGLLEHGRPGVEGDAARGGGQVRGRRQAERQEGPRHDRDVLRQRLRRPDRARRRQPADGQGARARPTRDRAVARDRLQPLHRARHRHGDRACASRRTPSTCGYWPL